MQALSRTPPSCMHDFVFIFINSMYFSLLLIHMPALFALFRLEFCSLRSFAQPMTLEVLFILMPSTNTSTAVSAVCLNMLFALIVGLQDKGCGAAESIKFAALAVKYVVHVQQQRHASCRTFSFICKRTVFMGWCGLRQDVLNGSICGHAAQDRQCAACTFSRVHAGSA